jgi:hypothetical protein
MVQIPSDFTEFLYWFKEVTETHWAANPIAILEEASDGWLHNAKWIGLTEDQIDSVENKYAVKFTPEHRAFLRVLHTTGRKEKIQANKVVDGKEVTVIEEHSYFYNWLTDDALIEAYLEWPFQTILRDVLGEKKVWLNSWGKKPDSEKEKKAVFAKWYEDAPLLLPLRAHTFLVSDITLEKRPALSVWGADVIIAGWSLQAYLISEFSVALGLTEMVFDDEDKVYYVDFKEGVLPTYSEYFQFKLSHSIPSWEEMILYFNWPFHKVNELE